MMALPSRMRHVSCTSYFQENLVSSFSHMGQDSASFCSFSVGFLTFGFTEVTCISSVYMDKNALVARELTFPDCNLYRNFPFSSPHFCLLIDTV